MAGRESADVQAAARYATGNPRTPLAEVARAHGIALSSLRRAMRRRGEPPRGQPWKGCKVSATSEPGGP